MVGVYAAIGGWVMGRVAPHFVVVNPMVVWGMWKDCEMVEECTPKRMVRPV